MKFVIKVTLLLPIFLWYTTVAWAQDSTSVADPEYKNKILFLPAVGSSPETGFLFGAVVVPQFKLGSNPDTRSSSVFTSAIYTLKNQILFSILPDIVLPGEKWILNGNYFANYYPESYWGLGPSSSEADEITTLYTQLNLKQILLRQIKPGFFVGPQVRWSKLYNLSFENSDGERIAPSNVNGTQGSTTVGLGWISRWDRRNSNMTPTRNHYVQFSFLGNASWLGSSHPYTLYELDARKYWDLSKDGRSILALQSLLQLNSGDPPFNDLAILGG